MGLQEMGRLSPPESVIGFKIKFIGNRMLEGAPDYVW